ncbi:MAG: DUF1616 domain-containing protein [Chloroflexi bacterium]|nr:DUF1616 domain-containing protein [Chloroflexota bacterium]
MAGGNSKDLYAVIALTLLAIGGMLLEPSGGIRWSLLALPLVFILPGYALAAALFAKSHLGFAETLAAMLGLSLAASVVGGVLLNATLEGLDTVRWTIYLAGVTLGGCAIAARRRQRAQMVPARLVLNLGELLPLVAAIIVLVSAIVIAREPAAQPSAAFTQLWARPAAVLGQTAVEVGVYNSEFKKMEYKLEVRAGPVLVYESAAIALAPGETWEKLLTFQSQVSGDVQVLLYRMDQPDQVYRQAVSRSSVQ